MLPGCRGKYGLAEALRSQRDDGLAVVFGKGVLGACCQTGRVYWVGFTRPAVTLMLFGILRSNLGDGKKSRLGEFWPARQK